MHPNLEAAIAKWEAAKNETKAKMAEAKAAAAEVDKADAEIRAKKGDIGALHNERQQACRRCQIASNKATAAALFEAVALFEADTAIREHATTEEAIAWYTDENRAATANATKIVAAAWTAMP